jgi:hypothetical protein
MEACRALLVCLVLLGLAACGSNGGQNGGDGGGAGDGNFRTCDTETRAVPYSPGMTRDSATAAFTVRLVSVITTPLEGPAVDHPAIGPATWTLTVADAAGAAVPEGTTVKAVPSMPDHTHPPPTLTAMPSGQGGYTLNLNLFMGGFWTVTLTIEPVGGATDTAVFPLCVQG